MNYYRLIFKTDTLQIIYSNDNEILLDIEDIIFNYSGEIVSVKLVDIKKEKLSIKHKDIEAGHIITG